MYHYLPDLKMSPRNLIGAKQRSGKEDQEGTDIAKVSSPNSPQGRSALRLRPLQHYQRRAQGEFSEIVPSSLISRVQKQSQR
ncbi:hypothetical protein QYF36_002998 [Acer negundo]|nr:hypothetical protein QYF36_002998 [Acer negundo]